MEGVRTTLPSFEIQAEWEQDKPALLEMITALSETRDIMRKVCTALLCDADSIKSLHTVCAQLCCVVPMVGSHCSVWHGANYMQEVKRKGEALSAAAAGGQALGAGISTGFNVIQVPNAAALENQPACLRLPSLVLHACN